MTDAVPGQTADVAFANPNIENGVQKGFMLYTERYILDLETILELTDSVLITQEKQLDGTFNNTFIIALRLSDGFQTPMGGVNFDTEIQQRQLIDQYLRQGTFDLVTRRGVYPGLRNDGGIISEKQFTSEEFSVVILKMKNTSSSAYPPDVTHYFGTVYTDRNAPGGGPEYCDRNSPYPTVIINTGYYRTATND